MGGQEMIDVFKRMSALKSTHVPDDSLQKLCISIALGCLREKQKTNLICSVILILRRGKPQLDSIQVINKTFDLIKEIVYPTKCWIAPPTDFSNTKIAFGLTRSYKWSFEKWMHKLISFFICPWKSFVSTFAR